MVWEHRFAETTIWQHQLSTYTKTMVWDHRLVIVTNANTHLTLHCHQQNDCAELEVVSCTCEVFSCSSKLNCERQSDQTICKQTFKEERSAESNLRTCPTFLTNAGAQLRRSDQELRIALILILCAWAEGRMVRRGQSRHYWTKFGGVQRQETRGGKVWILVTQFELFSFLNCLFVASSFFLFFFLFF